MKLVKPSITFLNMTENPLKAIEIAGRTCYKSEDKITKDSANKFVEMLIKRKHYAMIEHATASYRIVCDRGVTHEIVRHRLFSYAQESTRYCDYSKTKDLQIIIPCWSDGYFQNNEKLTHIPKYIPVEERMWVEAMIAAEKAYFALRLNDWTPQQARSVLPNSLKTEIVITGNLREWQHFFKLRCTPVNAPKDKLINGIIYTGIAPHPQMQEIANMVLVDIAEKIPIIFDEYLPSRVY